MASFKPGQRIKLNSDPYETIKVESKGREGTIISVDEPSNSDLGIFVNWDGDHFNYHYGKLENLQSIVIIEDPEAKKIILSDYYLEIY